MVNHQIPMENIRLINLSFETSHKRAGFPGQPACCSGWHLGPRKSMMPVTCFLHASCLQHSIGCCCSMSLSRTRNSSSSKEPLFVRLCCRNALQMAWQAEAGELEGSPHAAVGGTWQAEARDLGLKQKKI